MARHKKKHGPKRGSRHGSMESERLTFRAPYFQAGKWRVRVRDKVEGTISVRTLEADSAQAARQEVADMYAAQREVEREQKKAPEDRTVTEAPIREALAEWLETLEVRPITRKGYKEDIALYRDELGPERAVHSITLADFEQLLLKDWSELKGRTKCKHLGQLKRIFKWCLAHGYCRSNPTDHFQTPRAWRQAERVAKETTGQAISLKEARRLLRSCGKTHPLRLAITIALRTGLRRSNIFGSTDKSGLRWRDIDFKERTLTLDGVVMKNGNALILPLHPELEKALRDEQRRHKKLDLNAQVVRLRDPKKAWEAARERARLDDRKLRIHDLRATFATWLGEECPELVVAQLLGHARTSVTARYAQRQDLDKLRKEIERLEWLEPAKAPRRRKKKRA